MEGTSAIRVLIADEQASFRRALREMLKPELDLTIVGEASDADGVVTLVGELKPDVLLIEAALLGSLKGLTQDGLSMLVTVPALDRSNIVGAFLRGAKAVVPKRSASNVWPESIRTVVAGQYWLGSDSMAILILALRDNFSHGVKTPKDYKLTPREVEIIDKIATGHSNKEVGRAFSIRERTVKHHLTNIFAKVGVSSRLELALLTVDHRLLEVPPVREAISIDRHDSAKSRRKAD